MKHYILALSMLFAAPALYAQNVGIGTSSPSQKLDVNGNLALEGKEAIAGFDSWLRLNQSGQFASGTYTPGFFRVDGGISTGGVGSLGPGTIHSVGQVRAPIFYDYDNAGYYSDPNATSRLSTALFDQTYGAYNHATYGGVYAGDWQNLTNSAGQMNWVEVHNINGGGHSNQPTGLYPYGGVLSMRGASHSLQIYSSHTGDLAFKTQWGNDNYSGWRTIIHSGNLASQLAPFGYIPNNGSGDWQIASSNAGLDYSQSSLELREVNFGGANVTGPRLGFHWGGRVASQIGMEQSGRIAILNNPGTGYEALVAGNIYSAGTIYPGNTTTTLTNLEYAHPNGRIYIGGNLHIDSYNGHHIYMNYASPYNVFMVTGGGNVGINTTAPGYKLDVNGNAFVAGGLYTQGTASTLYGANASIYANQANANGGGIMISDDGGFVDYNDGPVTFVGSSGLVIAGSSGAASSNAYLRVKQLAGSGNRSVYADGNGTLKTYSTKDVAYVQDRGERITDASNVGYRNIGLTTGDLAVESGDVVTINVSLKFRWTGGSGGDHPYFGIAISGCTTTSVDDWYKHGTADDFPRGEYQVVSLQYVYVATCTGNLQFQLRMNSNVDADDNAGTSDVVIIAERH